MPWEDWRRLEGVVLLVSMVSSSSLLWSVKRRLREGGNGSISIVERFALSKTYYIAFEIERLRSNTYTRMTIYMVEV